MTNKDTSNQFYFSKFAIKLRQLISKPMKVIIKKIVTKKVTIVRNDFEPNGKPTIYLANHGFYEDIMAVISSIEDNVNLLIGVEGKSNTPKPIEKLALWLNGYLQINRRSKESKNKGFDSMVKILQNQGNLLMFPESIWNLTPNLLMLKLHWGALRMAELTGANVVPVIIDEVNGGYSVIIGKAFNYSKYHDRHEAIGDLRDIMATAVWELISLKEPVKRADISEEYWLNHIRKELSGFPNKIWHIEETYGFKPKDEVSLGEVLAELYGIEYRSMAASYEQYLEVEQLISNWNNQIKLGK